VIDVAGENEDNLWLACLLISAIQQVMGLSYIQLIRAGTKELQVHPIGDKWVNRKPDVMVIRPEHRKNSVQAIKLGMQPPLFVAEVVSPGGRSSQNYLRDYVWKRQQYEDWQIPEYWIIDPHREQITVLTLVEERYQEAVYKNTDTIVSTAFPAMQLTPTQLFAGDIC
ncbi:MAG: Uma2 family endonuclease, partial [Cyanobacteria bacterium J06554_3]